MMRPSVIVVATSMLAACGGLAYVHATRETAAEEPANMSKPAPATRVAAQPSTHASTKAAVASTKKVARTSPTSSETASAGNAATPETIAQWIKDTESTDPEVRAAAIAALGNAPKALAMPVLERVLETGERNVDRHVALRSMYSLALRGGDRDGQIRDVMRHAVYHGDDDAVTQTAQSLLDDIEAEFTQREQNDQSSR